MTDSTTTIYDQTHQARSFLAKFGAMLGMHQQIENAVNQLLGERVLRENANAGGGVAELDARLDKLKLQLAAVEKEVLLTAGKLTMAGAYELLTDLTVGVRASDELYEVFRSVTGRVELMRALGRITTEEEETQAAQLVSDKLTECTKQVELVAAKVPAARASGVLVG